MGIHLCPRCNVTKSQVPDMGKDFDLRRRQTLRSYAKDAAARVEDARRIIFDLGMSVGGELKILQDSSLVPTRVMHFIPSSLHLSSHISERILH